MNTGTGHQVKLENLISITFDGCVPGVIHEWSVQVGDHVLKGESIAVVTINNKKMQFHTNHAGVVRFLHPNLGTKIPEGQTIAQIELHCDPFDIQPIIETTTLLLKKRKQAEKKIEELNNEELHEDICQEIDLQLVAKRKEIITIYKKLLKHIQRKKIKTDYVEFKLTRKEMDDYCRYVPQLQLDPRISEKSKKAVTFYTICDSAKVDRHEFKGYFYGKSTSTYPYIEAKQSREGEPICDQYRVMFCPPISIIALADGCNWGAAPAEAAQMASKAFVNFIYKHKQTIRTTRRLSRLCLQGLCEAHNKIISTPQLEGKGIGTTTLLGGVVVKVILPTQEEIPSSKLQDWVFTFACIGDCKAFLWVKNKQFIEELTPDSRGENFMDASDCGGRIGPYIEGGPDLRNLEVFMSPCIEGDIIFVCTDGVHDNFDPQMLGVTPDQLGLPVKEWKECDAMQANAAKAEFRTNKMKELIGPYLNTDNVDIKKITNIILDYCEQMNLPSQTFMQENPGKRLPNDYTRFPGKMDHTSLIVLKVGEYQLPDDLTDFLNLPKLKPNPSSTTISSSASRESLLLSKRHSFYSKIPDNYVSRPVSSPLSSLPPPKNSSRPDSPIQTTTNGNPPAAFPIVPNSLGSKAAESNPIPQPQPQPLPPVKPSIIQPNLRPSHLPQIAQPAFKQITVPLLPLNECQPILQFDEPNKPRTAEATLAPPSSSSHHTPTSANSAPITSTPQQTSLAVRENPSKSKVGSYVQIYTQDPPSENKVKRPGSFLELDSLQPTNSLHGSNKYIRSYLDALASSNSNLFDLATPTSPTSPPPDNPFPASAPASVSTEKHHKKTNSISELYALDYLQDSPHKAPVSSPIAVSSITNNSKDTPTSTPTPSTTETGNTPAQSVQQSSLTVPHPLSSKEQSIDVLLQEMEIEEESELQYSEDNQEENVKIYCLKITNDINAIVQLAESFIATKTINKEQFNGIAVSTMQHVTVVKEICYGLGFYSEVDNTICYISKFISFAKNAFEQNMVGDGFLRKMNRMKKSIVESTVDLVNVVSSS